MKLSKLTTAQLEKKIADGKIPVDQLDDANTLLLKRKGEVKVTKIKKEEAKPIKGKKKVEPGDFIAAGEKIDVEFVPKKDKKVKKETAKKEKPAKKEKAPKVEKEKIEKAPATIADYETSDKTVSGLVKKMLMPAEGSTVAGCTYGAANKAVQKKFGRKLHTSEFQRNFDILAGLGILKEKLPPRYQSEEDKAKKEEPNATTGSGKTVKLKKKEEAAAEQMVDVQEGKH